jgi:hypothetical protein
VHSATTISCDTTSWLPSSNRFCDFFANGFHRTDENRLRLLGSKNRRDIAPVSGRRDVLGLGRSERVPAAKS